MQIQEQLKEHYKTRYDQNSVNQGGFCEPNRISPNWILFFLVLIPQFLDFSDFFDTGPRPTGFGPWISNSRLHQERFNDFDISWKSTSHLAGNIVPSYSENFQNNGKSCDRGIKPIIRVFPFDLKSVKFRRARISHYFEILLNISELSLPHIPCQLASGFPSNVKMIESPLCCTKVVQNLNVIIFR